MKNKINMNKKIKLVASTASARIGALLFSVAIVAIVASLIAQGVLNFEETLAITCGSILVAAIVVYIVLVSNFGGYLFFNLAANEFILCRNCKKTKYSLDLIYKVQVENKTVDLHAVDKVTEQETKSGTGAIKQKEYKKVHYKMPSYKNADQRKRYEVFAEKCNKILTEVVHRKKVVEVFRNVPAKVEETK